MAALHLAVVPYTTHPILHLGPFSIATFGILAGAGLVLGSSIARLYVQDRTDLDVRAIDRAAILLFAAGVVGARISWVLSHLELIDSVGDVVALDQGGLQFSGGFLGAIAVATPIFRKWPRGQRWIVIDGFALGLCAGLALGRLGCLSVGEHFGKPSTSWLAVRYDGGETREQMLGTEPLTIGRTFHHAALYELLGLIVLFIALAIVARRSPTPGTVMGTFCIAYGSGRFMLDSLRVNDERLMGLTGAQFLMIGIAIAGLWIWLRVLPQLAEVAISPRAPS
ncbi:MAG TPA: prolipoprotein diacylglyceryl transferase family protein [Iamia sp.]|nr:prolipoprotein diacylglyceryl transferase family protein [Iamia sp.]